MKSFLPIDDSLLEIQESLNNFNNIILIAAPGAGKTTRVPPMLLSKTNKKIIMLQPRRIAARAAAERIAEENNWSLGATVGYRVRFEDCTTPETKILILTEALLMKELLKEPTLNDYGIIILDEFHERNLFTDISLAALKELQELQRPDLKIVIMSATLDPVPLSHYLNPAKIITVQGKSFPVEIFYEQQPQLLNTDRKFIDRVCERILCVLDENYSERPILVFLPGISEINRVNDTLNKSTKWIKFNRKILSLHGSLSLSQQHQVLWSHDPKVILSTNVAETSLTIQDVDTVIDSGLARELQYDQKKLFPWLKTIRISKASAEQRKGRAGRQFPGRCYRLWSKLDETSFPSFSTPDILSQDITELILLLYQMGITDPDNFSWFEKPPKLNMEKAKQLLIKSGLIDRDNAQLYRLTHKGRWIQNLPLNSRLASLIYEGVKLNKIHLSIALASLLNERDPWSRENLEAEISHSQDSDIIPRLEALQLASNRNHFQLIHQTIKQTTKIVKRILESDSIQNPNSSNEITNFLSSNHLQINSNIISEILFKCFFDRIARRRKALDHTALTVGLKGVQLSSQSLVRTSEFFFCLQGHASDNLGNAIVDLAHPISKNLLLQLGSSDITVSEEPKYDSEKDSWILQTQKKFRDLPIEDPIQKPLQMSDEILIQLASKTFLEWRSNQPHLQNLFIRLSLAKKIWPNEEWPDQAEWEKNTIEMACFGEKTLLAVRDKNWNELFMTSLNKKQKQIFELELPLAIKVPNGKILKLSYDESFRVNLELKIQDAFGWAETPKIAQGKVKVRLILLGPHLRPIQTTDNLNSFWQGTYLELRPSLKARYPKHLWPEEPWKI